MTPVTDEAVAGKHPTQAPPSGNGPGPLRGRTTFVRTVFDPEPFEHAVSIGTDDLTAVGPVAASDLIAVLRQRRKLVAGLPVAGDPAAGLALTRSSVAG